MASRKIYFCGSIRGGRQDAAIYAEIIQILKAYGHVLTEHVGATIPEPSSTTETSDQHIFQRDMDWMIESDVVVAEVTQPSLGVGFEVGAAWHLKKRVLCLFRPQSKNSLSAMISGAVDDKNFFLRHYENSKELDKYFQTFFCS